ncbi:hypothetical protein [Streptomyces cynarae]|uniref:hypothetical protein n=1 Tax=Streptomyces cynarae TaxID=2981134 RepID=UPI0028BEE8A9|nr:hypothetical protein [Streptomyces cynarae]
MDLDGEIDILTAPPLGERLDDLTAPVHPDLMLDLRAASMVAARITNPRTMVPRHMCA